MNLQSIGNNSLQIRQEIQRFESVHPAIYAIYDLIDILPDVPLAQQFRDHVVCIEDSFVNSQEWTLSRNVPDIRIGILGSLYSGKSALVHRYLTGAYLQEESPEGGRFKKEIIVDNQSYLLLIRDEGGPPEAQFSAWVDAVIFVFSLENEASFNAIYTYYTKMSHYRNSADIPIILVGTQDAISENNPRIIDDSRARKLASDLKRCSYFETCATYGLNVERVFQEACQKVVQQRQVSTQNVMASTPTNSRPPTPSNNHVFTLTQSIAPSIPYTSNNTRHLQVNHEKPPPPRQNVHHLQSTALPNSSNLQGHFRYLEKDSPTVPPLPQTPTITQVDLQNSSFQNSSTITQTSNHSNTQSSSTWSSNSTIASATSLGGGNNSANNTLNCTNSTQTMTLSNQSLTTTQECLIPTENNNVTKLTVSKFLDNIVSPLSNTAASFHSNKMASISASNELPTPSSTPTTTRKSRRRSNLFTTKNKDDKTKNGSSLSHTEMGSGRVIPLKQGYLYKKSRTLNKEWKKKYVTLCNDGRLTYHPSLHDYMDDVHGKEIPLQYVTVKVPGQKPRGSKTITTNANALNESLASLSLTSFDLIKDASSGKINSNNLSTNGDGENVSSGMSLSQSISFLNGDFKIETPHVKKRHRRMKSNVLKNNDCDDSDSYEFFIISLDNKQWHFEAMSFEERNEWVAAIEQQILNSLQGNESASDKQNSSAGGCNSSLKESSLQAIRNRVPGNAFCADCDNPDPDWASLNFGILICIECSGIHRNLGSHISKVRSLDLDDWPPGHLSVMLAIGNKLANSVWEANTKGHVKPTPKSPREEKEKWIRQKYETKQFILNCSNVRLSFGQQLIEAICRSDMKSIISVLAHASKDDVNTTINASDLKTPLHFSCAMGDLAITQLLIWNQANVKSLDRQGRSCLVYALKAAEDSIVNSNNGHLTSGIDLEATRTSHAARNLCELLIQNGCPDIINTSPSSTSTYGTLLRRRIISSSIRKKDVPTYEKIPSSVV